MPHFLRLASLSLCLSLPLAASPLAAQSADKPSEATTVRTFYLRNVTQSSEANEILTGIRNTVDPTVRIYLDPSQNALVARGTPDQLAEVQQIIDSLDKPKHTYHLTYTITESDSGKKLGVQHFTVALASGARAVVKQGSKVPVVTGSYSAGSGAQSQFTYIDVGLNFDITLTAAPDGFRLQNKVEQSSVLEEKQTTTLSEPVIRQTVLEGTTILIPGKPLNLGSLDTAGSTRHLDFEVTLEPIH